MKKTFLFTAVVVAAIGIRADAQTLISPTLNDGGFESITGKSNFTLATSATAAIPYWGATGINSAGTTVGAPNDSGGELDGAVLASAANNNVNHTGASGGFWQPSTQALASTAFNLVTTNPIAAGNVYTLTWYGRATGNGGAQIVSLFSQLPGTVGATYTYQPSATLITVNGVTNATYALTATRGDYQFYSLSYTATAADAGKLIGLTYGSSGTSYIGGDDFTLTVQVPEPGTWALLVLGGGMLALVARRRCSKA